MKKNNKVIYIAITTIVIAILLIFLMLFQNKNNQKDVVDARLYNIWNPHGAILEKDGSTSDYNDYDMNGYIVISKTYLSTCIKDGNGENICNNYEYTGTREYIEINSDDKYLSGKFLYEITKDEDLILTKEQDDGSKIKYTYGHPKG